MNVFDPQLEPLAGRDRLMSVHPVNVCASHDLRHVEIAGLVDGEIRALVFDAGRLLAALPVIEQVCRAQVARRKAAGEPLGEVSIPDEGGDEPQPGGGEADTFSNSAAYAHIAVVDAVGGAAPALPDGWCPQHFDIPNGAIRNIAINLGALDMNVRAAVNDAVREVVLKWIPDALRYGLLSVWRYDDVVRLFVADDLARHLTDIMPAVRAKGSAS